MVGKDKGGQDQGLGVFLFSLNIVWQQRTALCMQYEGRLCQKLQQE